MKKLMIAFAVASLTVSTVASADVGIDLRQTNQQRLIDAGKRSGKLSRRERDVLTREQYTIKAEEGRLRGRHGGRLTNADEARIMAMLDRSQRHITRLKNNRERGRNGIHI